MTTARDFVTLAMKEAGVLGVGQTLLAEDVNDGFTLLNRMLAQWQKKRWIVPSLMDIAMPGNSLKSNKIGPGQYYNTLRPDKIQAAYFKQLNTGNDVSFPLRSIWSYEDYALVALKEMSSWPNFFFYDAAFPYGNVFIWPIPDNNIEVHLIIKSPIGFDIEIEEGEITDAGSGYVDGAYVAVPLVTVTGTGSGATADITVAGGVVTIFEINDGGDGYNTNDTVTASNTSLGGTGADLLWKVTEVTSTLDAVFNMPAEYEEAIHYNLCIRLCSMYQYPVNPVQAGLAKLALNTIKVANSQIPTLKMPSGYSSRNNGSFYIYNADAR